MAKLAKFSHSRKSTSVRLHARGNHLVHPETKRWSLFMETTVPAPVPPAAGNCLEIKFRNSEIDVGKIIADYGCGPQDPIVVHPESDRLSVTG